MNWRITFIKTNILSFYVFATVSDGVLHMLTNVLEVYLSGLKNIGCVLELAKTLCLCDACFETTLSNYMLRQYVLKAFCMHLQTYLRNVKLFMFSMRFETVVQQL